MRLNVNFGLNQQRTTAAPGKGNGHNNSNINSNRNNSNSSRSSNSSRLRDLSFGYACLPQQPKCALCGLSNTMHKLSFHCQSHSRRAAVVSATIILLQMKKCLVMQKYYKVKTVAIEMMTKKDNRDGNEEEKTVSIKIMKKKLLQSKNGLDWKKNRSTRLEIRLRNLRFFFCYQ